jgi:DNA mismatch repair protein MutL
MNPERKIGDRSIHLLRDSVARKIAAGEVIDRPFSLLREMLDNAVDSGADSIEVHLYGGGTGSVRVVDNGCGMSREDLELCFLPHATSKITEVEDLDRITSLGFRGEALSSIAACSRLTITSAAEEGNAHTLNVENGKLIALEPSRGRKGTVAEAADLFYSIPARKRFLKSNQAELTACRKLFTEKAAAFPEISFRFFSEGELKIFLPAGPLTDRLLSCYPGQLDRELLHSISGEFPLFRFTALASGLSLYRRDRRFIHIYVNRRKIDEFSLIQAVEYGYGEYLPGGSFPLCFLFLDIDPDRVDFNIHPAKREVRFRDLKSIHHEVSSAIRSYLRERWLAPPVYRAEPSRAESSRETGFSSAESISSASSPLPRSGHKTVQNRAFYDRYEERREREESEKREEIVPFDFRYLGQVFGLFLAVEREGVFYLIDQHAAHERILYDRFTGDAGRRQRLLIPRELDLEEEVESLITGQLKEYRLLGIDIERIPENRGWQLTALPENCLHLENEIVSFLQSPESGKDRLSEKLFADLACKAAVKEGEYLPPEQARTLIRDTFRLEQQRCPHGRPVFFAIEEQELYRAVGRT